jgi:hypothetical protein
MFGIQELNSTGESRGLTVGEHHFLLKTLKFFPRGISINAPEDCEYDNRYGAWFWKLGRDSSVLVKAPNPERPKPQTKKFDVETGEDLKGE